MVLRLPAEGTLGEVALPDPFVDDRLNGRGAGLCDGLAREFEELLSRERVVLRVQVANSSLEITPSRVICMAAALSSGVGRF
jgi:hypothetical protein